MPDLRAKLTALVATWEERAADSYDRSRGQAIDECAEELDALLREPPARPERAAAHLGQTFLAAWDDHTRAARLTRADVEALWEATADPDDWTHIRTFAAAVCALHTARAAAPKEP